MNRLVVVGLLSLASCATAAYPTKYPYEDTAFAKTWSGDQLLPDKITPTFSYNAKDTGNYINLVYKADSWYGDAKQGYDPKVWHFTCTRVMENFRMAFLKLPTPNTPAAFMNCTSKDAGDFSASSISTKINGKTVCGADCCSYMYGSPQWQKDMSQYVTGFEGMVTAGNCPTPSEHVHCMYSYRNQRNCLEQYQTPGARKYTFPCHDVTFAYFMSCKLYKLSGMSTQISAFEPEPFMKTLTPLQTVWAAAVVEQPDRVCNPYNYFYPDEAPSTPSSSALAQGLFSAAFAALMCLA